MSQKIWFGFLDVSAQSDLQSYLHPQYHSDIYLWTAILSLFPFLCLCASKAPMGPTDHVYFYDFANEDAGSVLKRWANDPHLMTHLPEEAVQ